MSEKRTQMKPERAVNRYLSDKKPEWAESTYYNNSTHPPTNNSYVILRESRPGCGVAESVSVVGT